MCSCDVRGQSDQSRLAAFFKLEDLIPLVFDCQFPVSHLRNLGVKEGLGLPGIYLHHDLAVRGEVGWCPEGHALPGQHFDLS